MSPPRSLHTQKSQKHNLEASSRLDTAWHTVLTQFSCSVMFHSLLPDGLQQARLPCLLPTPRACSNSRPLSQWCHPTILSSVVPFSFCLQSFPASGSFPMSQLIASVGQRIGVSASVLPVTIKGCVSLGLSGLISLLFKGLSRVFSSTTIQKHQFFSAQPSLWSNSYLYMTTEKTIALIIRTFSAKWCLCFLICCLGLS